MKVSKSDAEQLSLQIEKLRQSQLAEIDHRCSEVDALKQQLTYQLTSLQQNCSSLSCQLTEASAENAHLLERNSLVEVEKERIAEQLSKKVQEQEILKSKLKNMSLHVEKLEGENKAVHSRLILTERYVE